MWIGSLGRWYLLLALGLLSMGAQAQSGRACTRAQAGGGWLRTVVVAPAGAFSVDLTVTPSRDDVDAVVGLSPVAAAAGTQFAVRVQFGADGRLRVLGAEGQAGVRAIRYTAGQRYHLRFDVDPTTRTVSAWAQRTVGSRARASIVLASGLPFGADVSMGAVINSLSTSVGVAADGQSAELMACRLTVNALTPPPPNADCTLIVPEAPLSAQGLATPYQLVATNPARGACHQTQAAQAAFVQAAILDPATGQISIYSPLVIDKGSEPAAAPVLPVLPPRAIVGLWFGYNGDRLTLRDRRAALTDGRCVNGLGDSVFGQFAHCNAPAFFAAATAAVQRGQLVVPPLRQGVDGQTCPSSRSPWVIDQDPSDNVPTEYLAVGAQLAQVTAANQARFPTARRFGNPSDERLVALVLDPVLRCSPWRAPDLADPGRQVTALALNELQAAVHQARPVALVPVQDPMAQVDGVDSLAKLNLYRRGVGQPEARSADRASAVATCQTFRSEAPARFLLDRPWLQLAASPSPGESNSLFTFMARRYVASYELLGCERLLHQPVNVDLVLDSNDVVIDAGVAP